MPLESGTYTSDLNASNPVGASDPKSQGDDHIRLIKSTIKNTLPNLSGAMTLTHTQLNSAAIKSEQNDFTSSGTRNTAPVRIVNNNPDLAFYESDGPVDEKGWDFLADSGAFLLRTYTDAGTSGQNAIQVNRTGTNVDSIQLFVDNSINVDAIGGGLLRVRSPGSTDTETRQIRFSHQDGTNRGSVGHENSDTFYIRNTIHGGIVRITAEDAGGTAVILADLDPDGAFKAYHDGTQAFQTHNAGIHISDTTGSHNPYMGFYDQNFGTRQGYVQFQNGSTGIVIQGEIHGANINLQAEDAGGTSQKILQGDPDGTVYLAYAGSAKIFTQSDGMAVRGSLANAQGSAVDTYITLDNSDGSDRGYVGFLNTVSLEMRSLNNGGNVLLRANDAGGTLRSLFVADPDGAAGIYYNGDEMIRTTAHDGTGNTAAGEIRDHGSVFREIGFNVLPTFNDDTSDTLEARHCGKINTMDGVTNRTLTLAASSDLDFPVDGVTHIENGSAANNYNVDEGTGTTLYYLEPGAGLVDTTGGAVVGPGGSATIRRVSATVYHIMGSEITYTP